jgi:mannose/cellobiose epimerase-like protein (N-acyl-D-glucosamine 2-epimerase family)
MSSTAPLARLLEWLNGHAYPVWWERGADREHGGFHEKISQDGAPVLLPKRARVLPRQIYAFSQAKALGWAGDGAEAVRFGMDFYLAHFFRPDGLVRTLVAPDGAALDDKAAFYDQAFALLGLHSAYVTLGDSALLDRARALMRRWSEDCKHPVIGFEESVPRTLPLGANPHMHMFESCLAWAESDAPGPWRAVADEIAELALTRFIDANSGALREFFAGDWTPMPGEQGRIVEPGHQFEWGWLLLRWGRLAKSERAIAAGLRLVEIGEKHGVDKRRNVACNTLRDDFSRVDWRARLWPQTERIKAHCLAAETTGRAAHWDLAAMAAEGLLQYFATPIEGLWFDMLTEHDGMIAEPAPASSFYHIVCAVAEFRRAASL